MNYTIHEGVPVPAKRPQGRPELYPWRQLQVGSSFTVQTDDPALITRIRSAVRGRNRRYPKRRYEWRLVEGGIGVWRIK
jgi:hypothetical protein